MWQQYVGPSFSITLNYDWYPHSPPDLLLSHLGKAATTRRMCGVSGQGGGRHIPRQLPNTERTHTYIHTIGSGRGEHAKRRFWCVSGCLASSAYSVTVSAPVSATAVCQHQFHARYN